MAEEGIYVYFDVENMQIGNKNNIKFRDVQAVMDTVYNNDLKDLRDNAPKDAYLLKIIVKLKDSKIVINETIKL